VDPEGWYSFIDRIGDTFRWKGENVSTQEVAEHLSSFQGIEQANVYGVRVEAADGRAGMAALVLDTGVSFDGTAFASYVNDRMPAYAAPVFVRIVAKPDMTGTFKLRKVDLQREGFDLDIVSDPIWVRNEDGDAYVPLTPSSQKAIENGSRRL
jgi:fatty-acyl-CoA synthase